jgi:hypothetical protein
VDTTTIHHEEGFVEVESATRPGHFWRTDGHTCPCPAREMCRHKRIARVRLYKRRHLRVLAERVAHEDLGSEERLELMHEARALGVA